MFHRRRAAKETTNSTKNIAHSISRRPSQRGGWLCPEAAAAVVISAMLIQPSVAESAV